MAPRDSDAAASSGLGDGSEAERLRSLLEAAEARAAELSRANTALLVRSRMLAVVAEVSTLLHAAEDLDAAVAEALRRVGEAAGLSRVKFFVEEERRPGGPPDYRIAREWCAPGLRPQAELGFGVIASEDVAALTPALREGRAYWMRLDEVPAPIRERFRHVGVQATGCVPVFVDGRFAACVAFDDCVASRTWDAAQVDALTATAAAIGAALQARRARERFAAERERVAQERAAELARANAALRGTLARLAQEPDLGAFLGHALGEVARHAGARAGHLFLHDPEANTLRQHAVVRDGTVHLGHRPDDPPLFHAPFPADITPAFRTAVALAGHYWAELTTLKAFPYPDTLWPGTFEWHKRMGHTAISGSALMVGERPVGFLGLAYSDRNRLTESQVELVEALGNQAALAIELKRLADRAREAAVAREREKAAEERAAELARANAALRQAIESLRDLDDLDAFLAKMVAAAEQVSGAAQAAVFLIDVDRREMQARLFVRGGAVLDIASDPTLAPWREVLTDGQGYNQRVADMIFGTPGHWWVPVDDPLMPADSRAWHEAQGHRSAANVPMFRDGRPLGFLGLAFREPVRPSEAKLEMVQVLAQQATLAFELTRLANEAREAAIAREREQAAQERAAELARANAALTRSTARLADRGDLDAFLGTVLVEAAHQTSACSNALFLYDPAAQALTMRTLARGGDLLDIAADPRMAL